eukprot:Nitzschia sp. Nitz4//NODE_159_length_47236_cov_74.723851//20062//25674//NITZ4_additional_000009-RA//1//CDS//3329531746//8074//frame0
MSETPFLPHLEAPASSANSNNNNSQSQNQGASIFGMSPFARVAASTTSGSSGMGRGLLGTATVATATTSASPSQPIIPPRVLTRQSSDISAWVSEVDSHYHSDVEDMKDDEEDEVHNITTAFIPQSIGAARRLGAAASVDDEELTQLSSAGVSYHSSRSLALSEVDSVTTARGSIASQHAPTESHLNVAMPGSMLGETPNQVTPPPSMTGAFSHAWDLVNSRLLHQAAPQATSRPVTPTPGSVNRTEMTPVAANTRVIEPPSTRSPSPYIPTQFPGGQTQTQTHLIPHLPSRPRIAPMFPQAQQSPARQSGGHDTSELSGGRKGAQAGSSSQEPPNKAKESGDFLLHVLQHQSNQAEERSRSLTHRLALEERLHRQTVDELREAQWETSRLQEKLYDQSLQLARLERKQVPVVAPPLQSAMRSTLPTATADGSSQQQVHLARLEAEQEQAKQQTKQLFRDLKRSQDRLIKVENQKLTLLTELADLKAAQEKNEKHQVVALTSSSVQTQLDQANAEIVELRASKLALETKLQDAIQQEESLQQKLMAIQTDFNELKRSHKELEEERSTLVKRVRFADEQQEAQQQEVSVLQSDNNVLRDQLRQASDEHQEQVKRLEASSEQLRSEKLALEESHRKAMMGQSNAENHLQAVQKELAEAVQSLGAMEASLKATETAKEQLEAMASSERSIQMERVDARVVDLQQKNMSLQDKLNDTFAQIQHLQSALEASHVDLQSLNEEKQSALDREISLHEDLSRSEQKCMTLETKRSSLEKNLESLQRQLCDTALLEQNLHEAEAILSKLQESSESERKELERQLAVQTAAVQGLETQVKALKSRNNELIKEKEVLAIHADELRSSMEMQRVALERELDDKLRDVRNEFVDLQATVASLEKTRNELHDEIHVSKCRVKELEEQLEAASLELAPLHDKLEEASKQVSVLEFELKGSREQYDTVLANHAALEEQFSTLSGKSIEAQAELSTTKAACEKAEETVTLLNGQVDLLQEAVTQLEHQREGLEAALTESRQKAEVEGVQFSVRTDALEEQIAVLKSEKVALEGVLSSLKEDLENAKSQLSEKESMYFSAQQRNDTLTAEVNASVDMINHLNREIEGYQENLENLKSEKGDLTSRKLEIEQRLEETEIKLTQELSTNLSLREDLSTFKTENDNLSSQLANAREESHNFKSQTQTLQSVQKSEELLKHTLTKELESIQLENAELLAGASTSNLKLEQALSTVASLEERLLVAAQQTSEVQNALDCSIERCNDLETKKKALEDEFALAVANRDAATQQVNSLLVQQEQHLLKAEQMHSEFESLRLSLQEESAQTMAAKDSEILVLEEKLKESVAALTAVESELSAAKEARQLVHAEKEAALQAHAALEAQFVEEKEKLVVQLDELERENAAYEAQVSKSHDDVQSLEARIQAQSESSEQMRYEFEAQKTLLQEQLAEAIALKDSEVEMFEEKLKDSVAALTAVEVELSAAKEASERVHAEKEAALQAHAALEAQLLVHQSDLDSLRRSHDDSISEQSRLKSANDTLQEGVDALNVEVENLRELKADSTTRLSQLETLNTTFQGQVEKLESEATSLRNEVEKLTAKNDEFSSENSRLAAEQAALLASVEEKEKLLVQLAELERENTAYEEQISTSQENIRSLEADMEKSREAASASDAVHLKMEAEVGRLRGENDELHVRVSALEQELVEVRESSSPLHSAPSPPSPKDDSSTSEELIQQLTQEKESLTSQLLETETHLASLKSQLSGADDKKEDTTRKLELQILENIDTMRNLAQLVSTYKKDNRDLKKVARRLVKRIRDLEGVNSNATDEVHLS